nr:ATP synthase F0 subunit 8 [Beringiana fukuharai]BCV68737.1 ATP synthase F0 subunit 8 [Beringiana fukuharai]
MPQLSPMSWVMVIGIFLICFVFFSVTMWWWVEGKYFIKGVYSKKGTLSKSPMKWGFGKGLAK